MQKVSLRLVVLDVPPQDVITRDNVSIKVNAVVYFRVMDSNNAVVQVENFLYATSQLAQTTLRSVLGQVELDELLAERDKINKNLQDILDRQSGRGVPGSGKAPGCRENHGGQPDHPSTQVSADSCGNLFGEFDEHHLSDSPRHDHALSERAGRENGITPGENGWSGQEVRDGGGGRFHDVDTC
jgi:hypothetical protein